MRETPMLIGIVGHAGAGKSTVAKTLVDHGFMRMRFADTLKNMLRVLGLTDAQLDGHEKERPCALLDWSTPRHAMQTLGTEWGRELISYHLWVNAAMADMDRRNAIQTFPVVFDDVRFENEAVAIRARGGEIWRVVRGKAGSNVYQHNSEVVQDHIVADISIINDDSIEKLALMAAIKLSHTAPDDIPVNSWK